MKGIFRHKKLLGLISIFLVVVAAGSFWQYHTGASVEASGVVSIDVGPSSGNAPGLDTYSTSGATEKSANYYEIDYPGSGSKIEIGNVLKTSHFKPDLTISAWNREAEFKLITLSNIEEKSQLTSSLAGNNIAASNGEWKFEYKPTEPKVGFNDKGGVDILITAKAKPTTNKIYFTYDSNTVTPYYQPPLTEEYHNGWSDAFQCEISVTETQVIVAKATKQLKAGQVLVERPDYVVGSIAFYANSKANYGIGGVNYATGKVGHLYAMQCNGQWCRWTIESKNIVLTIPYEVFDKGVYPLVIAPVGDTFGYTSVPASNDSGNDSRIWATGEGYTPASAGTATSITVYSKSGDNSHIQMGLYTVSGTTATRIGYTGNTAAMGQNAAWYSANFVTNPSITAQPYYLFFITETGSGYQYFDTTGSPPDVVVKFSATYGVWPNPMTIENYGGLYWRFGIYCTYTPNTSASISNTPSSYNFGAVTASSTTSTGLNYFGVTNNSGSAVNITIGGTDITGGTAWTLSDTATPGADTIGIKAGLDGYAYNIIVKKTSPFNTLKSNLAASASQNWGLQLLAPTSYTDTVLKAGTITLTATIP